VTGKKEKLLKIFRENTGKVTHNEQRKEPSARELKGYQPSRVKGIATFRSGCNYGT
jgi:hypothetical protein